MKQSQDEPLTTGGNTPVADQTCPLIDRKSKKKIIRAMLQTIKRSANAATNKTGKRK